MKSKKVLFHPKERYLVPAFGPEAKALAVALAAVAVLCEKHKSDAVIVVPALKDVDTTVLTQVIPEAQLKQLASGNSLGIAGHYKLSMSSKATYRQQRQPKVVFAPFASKELIEMIEGSRDCAALVVVPWNSEDAKAWDTLEGVTILKVPPA